MLAIAFVASVVATLGLGAIALLTSDKDKAETCGFLAIMIVVFVLPFILVANHELD